MATLAGPGALERSRRWQRGAQATAYHGQRLAPGPILAIARGLADGIRWVCAAPVVICSPWSPDPARFGLCRSSHHHHDSVVRVASCGVPVLQAPGELAIHCSSQSSGR